MTRRDLSVLQTQVDRTSSTGTQSSHGHSETETLLPGNGLVPADLIDADDRFRSQQTWLSYLQLFWANRSLLLRAAILAVIASTAIAFLVPVRYQSMTRLMPPDGQSGGLGLLAAMSERSNVGALGSLAGGLLGVKSTGALFVGILSGNT